MNIIAWITSTLAAIIIIIYLIAYRDLRKFTNRIHKHSYVINFYQDPRVRNLQDMFFIKSDYSLVKKLQNYELVTDAIIAGDFTGNEIIYLASIGLNYINKELQEEGVL